MENARRNNLMVWLEAPAHPFARCIAQRWRNGFRQPKLLTAAVFLITLGPVSLLLRLAGMPGVAAGEGQDMLVSVGLWVMIAVGCEILVTRVARRLDASDAPSLTDRFWFWVAPWSGPVVFLLCSV